MRVVSNARDPPPGAAVRPAVRRAAFVPPKLREFARGGLWYNEDPPLKPMSGPKFDEWCAEWERQRRAKEAWNASIGSTSGGGAPLAGEEEEDEDPAFLKAIQESLKDAAERKSAEEEDRAAAIAAVKEAEAEADGYIIDLSD
ncbi:hypothetical protein QYE76_060300 [Lolium multiflorum]|uniref:Uncharacterized protein n=1 Tax=Lolium multiflorum TaxID=4521 RepID=A0AAD8S0Z7_LOLMU|nr:hypothetical protein QYE76_060300 [Lolium multiflorum]